jgi:predicted small secreted protein
MKRSAIVLVALCLVTLAGCKAEPGQGVDADQGGSSVGSAGQKAPAQGTPAPGQPASGPSVAPGPGTDTSEIDSDLTDVDNLLNDTDGDLSGADETPPDQD